ncbi:HNH endonuclease [Haliscomenobacter sp.]|uniref:HNH endonuclease n=1 Tax=Haliscomenobacter sp. TaxID=2717303 RepID=UPI0035946068
MIKVHKDFEAIPRHLTQKTAQQQTLAAVAAQDGSMYIRNYKHPPVKTALSKIYHHKCAYCESTITHSAPLQVEHYRPKAKLDQQDLKAGETHQGYYWLGNEWSNLLLACQNCNGKGAKGNRFPIAGIRLLNHPSDVAHYSILHEAMQAEKPLLLNPEIVDPLDHLYLDQDGFLHGKSNSGNISIDVYNLNREGLRIRRQTIINQFFHDLNKQLIELLNPIEPLTPDQFQRQMNLIFKRIFDGRKPNVEYSFVYINIVSNFDTILLPFIEQEFQPIINRSFQIFIQTQIF